MINFDKPIRTGDKLNAEDRAHVLRAYVHRYTREHIPTWANVPSPSGQPYPVQFASDAEWLAHTVFQVTTAGRLDRRVTACQSAPTWPDGDPRPAWRQEQERRQQEQRHQQERRQGCRRQADRLQTSTQQQASQGQEAI